MKRENFINCILNHAIIPGWAISTGQIPLAIRRVVIENNCPALASEEDGGFLDLLVHSMKYELALKYQNGYPPQLDIRPLCLFGLSICFTDMHDRTFPRALYPSSSAVSFFIHRVLENNRPVEPWEQLRFGLEDANHLIEAGLICMWANRIMARDLDRRSYPQIRPDLNTMRQWNSKLAPLPAFGELSSEPSGDTYYFWTNVCMALVIENSRKQRRNHKTLNMVEATYQYGAEIMFASRLILARQKMASLHKAAATLGYAVGWSLAQHIA